MASDLNGPEELLHHEMSVEPPPADFPNETRTDAFGRMYAYRDGAWVREPQFDNAMWCMSEYSEHPITLSLPRALPSPSAADDLMAQAHTLRELRRECSLSQEQVAALLGTTQARWSRAERGLSRVRPEFVAGAIERLAPYRARPRQQGRSSIARPVERPERVWPGDPSGVDWLAVEAAANGVRRPEGDGGGGQA